MKNKKLFATIAVIIGGILVSTGILIGNFMPEEKKDSGINHDPIKIDKCKSTSHEEKNTFIIRKIILNEEDKNLKYKLLKESEDYSELIIDYEQNDEYLQLDFTNYDYLVYFMYEDESCSRLNYLTNYSLESNTLNIEFTKSELDKTKCEEENVYGYGIAIEKDKFVEGKTKVEVTNKEDPYKDCYK